MFQPEEMEVEQPIAKYELMKVAETAGIKRLIDDVEE